MARKKYVLCDFREPCPRCGAPLAGGLETSAGGIVAYWRCAEHGKMTDTAPVCETRKGKLGTAWVLSYLGLVDERPEILASGLPFFVLSDLEGMKDMTEAERKAHWDRACRATLKERNDRAADPKRRIDRGTRPAKEEA